MVELRQTNLQGMPDPDTLLFPFESLVTPTNPPWTGFAGQAYEVDAEAIVSGYPDTRACLQSSSDAAFRKSRIEEWRGSMVSLQTRPSSANPSPQFVALHIGPDGQGGYEVKRMLAGDLWDCVAPTQSGCELKGKVMMNYTSVALDYSIPERGRMAGTVTGTVEFRLSPVWDSADIIFTFDVYFINDKP